MPAAEIIPIGIELLPGETANNIQPSFNARAPRCCLGVNLFAQNTILEGSSCKY